MDGISLIVFSVIFPFYLLFVVARFDLTSNRSQSLVYSLLPKPKMDPKYRKYIFKYFNLYVNLDEKQRKQFERRVQQFIDIKTFYPRSKGMRITDEMKVIINYILY